MQIPEAPSYDGRGLVNLMSEIEAGFGGSPLHAGLAADLRSPIPSGATTVMVLFDGLGSHQLDHTFAVDLAASNVGALDAPFTTTTTVSLTTIATGRTATEHGVVGYTLVDPSFPTVVNTIHLRSVFGDDVGIDPSTFVGGDRIWERLGGLGVEPVVVQPGNFVNTPLTRMLYRGARFEAYHHPDEVVDVTLDVAGYEGRFIFCYVPFVDVAAHVSGQRSAPYSEAVRLANSIWDRLCHQLPDHVALIGTADHGHVDIPEDRKVRIPAPSGASTSVAGDPRVLFLHDEVPSLESPEIPGVVADVETVRHLWGPGEPSATFERRLPKRILFVEDGYGVFTPAMNDRLVGYHGGLTDAERAIPLLVRR